MGFFAAIGILVIFYYLVNIVLWCVLDSDIELFIKSLLGKKIDSLSGKVVWITGASSGIGKQLALTLAKNGVKLVISARRGAELENVKLECLEAAGGKLTFADILVLQMDMMAISRHQILFDQVIAHFTRLDILVNNAGRSQRAAWQDINLSVDKELFELDVFAVVNLSRIAVRYFLAHNIIGQIAVTSSTAGLLAVPNSASYTGAKHALHGYFESLQVEQPKLNITIFCPGPTVSDFLQECFTSREGEKYGQPVKPTDRRMTGERCAQLYAIALANRTFINWIGCFPVPLLVYFSMNFPNIKDIMMKIIGTRTLQRIRDSN